MSVRLNLGDAIELWGNPIVDAVSMQSDYFVTDNASLAYDKPANHDSPPATACFDFNLLTDSDKGGEGTPDNLHSFHSLRLKKKGFTDCV